MDTENADDKLEPMTFRLRDLEIGKNDPRGREVLDVFWSVDEFKIYKTEAGINPFFSDNKDIAKQQKDAYLSMGRGIAEFNHLILSQRPNAIPFTNWSRRPSAARASALALYERELARCLAEALFGRAAEAFESLAALKTRLCARISNRGRVMHLGVNIILVAIAVAGGLLFARSGYVSAFGFNVKEMAIAIMMGSVGALFSTTVRLQSMVVDPSVEKFIHWVYGAQRVLVGALGALILYFGFRSGVVNGIFQPVGGAVVPGTEFNLYWLSFISVLAGFSERLVPNLLDSRADAAMAKEEKPQEAERKPRPTVEIPKPAADPAAIESAAVKAAADKVAEAAANPKPAVVAGIVDPKANTVR